MVNFTQNIPIASEDYAFFNSYEFTTFNQIGDTDMITRFAFQGRTINSLTDEDVRISKRLYVPSKKLRGFQAGKVGPVDSGDFIGGNHTSTVSNARNIIISGITKESYYDDLKIGDFTFNPKREKKLQSYWHRYL